MKGKAIGVHGAVWMTVEGNLLGGESRIALLAKVQECGSITQAAKAIKMSYKAAWDAIDQMNNLAGEALVARSTGGKGGGGTHLTPRGAQLVANFHVVEREHRRFIDALGAAGADDFALIRRLNMKTSARNQFAGIVSHVRHGAVNDEVTLSIAGGQAVVAVVTHESALEMALAAGVQALALVKDSSVVLVTGAGAMRFSARNQMAGTVERITPGAVNTEVVLALEGGGSLAAIVTNDSCAALGLAPGAAARGIFKASSVILAVPA
ncbi:MAG: TOBE domain-containing protein [Pseudomonadota bacterium]